MEKAKSALTLLPTVLLGGISIIYLLEWRQARVESASILTMVTSTLDRSEKRSEVQALRWTAVLEGLRKGQESLLALLSRGPVGDPAKGAETNLQEVPSAESSEPPAEDKAGEVDDLPPLPDGIAPIQFVDQWSLSTFLEDPRWNPGRKVLTRAEKNKAIDAVVQARAMMQILDSRVRVETAEGMEKKRQSGEFVEYERGQPPAAIQGVFSAGEGTEGGGMRLYYFYPEEHPGIYEARRQKNEVAKIAVRKLLSLVYQ